MMELKIIQYFSQSMHISKIANINHISVWKSERLSDERIEPRTTFDNNLTQSATYIRIKLRVKLDSQCLKEHKVRLNHNKFVNIYIVYEINLWPYKQSTAFILVNFLFVAVRSVKSADFGKYKYSRYGIGFNTHGSFSLSSEREFGKNVIFCTGMSSSVHNDNNNKKSIFILSKDLRDRLDDTTLATDKEYSMSFSEEKKTFV